ncbi:hypothetical protein VOLCADRAFT_89044 [Volvox carteri f. nagariensis]|uniref:ADP-ribosylation/Crystallin J1 n=1 Tax=Volvox carteri f. nagariensis TaxID=3068 RepID=D8TQM9_VOLCA|nr:uncharacterized protein VOLCADRAFT_89044 [Volvox carteri f. nagariensis]EFJ50062.1 hypothetical protein VOLCADRAFT_89044 [Volvox carteri f. nagariensis]|eukprot:XP_002948682.1 hypothetical protein VOLCADRAFT_89044 [Volvox carteri f. nagariensis]
MRLLNRGFGRDYHVIELRKYRQDFMLRQDTSSTHDPRLPLITGSKSVFGDDGDGGHDEELVRRRAIGAVLGALVADAATMGLHWIYDLEKIRELVSEQGRSEEPAFFQPPSCPYYQYESGSLSPYGDELLPVLQYMTIGPGSHRDGTLDGPGFAQYLAEYYANYTGRLNKSSRAMMEALLQGGHGWPECGDPRDTQANNFVKVVPLVARYAGQPGRLVGAVDAAVRAQQNNDEAVMYALVAALVLERVVLGSSISDATQWAADGAPGSGVALSRSALEALRAVVRHHHSGTALRDLLYAPGSSSQAGSWGPSCANPGALQGALLGALQASPLVRSRSSDSLMSGGGGGGDDTAFARGVRANLLLGGDNCSRGILLGALLGAEAGLGAIPFSWRAQTRVYDTSEVLVEHLMELRGAGGPGGPRQS